MYGGHSVSSCHTAVMGLMSRYLNPLLILRLICSSGVASPLASLKQVYKFV